MVRIIDVSLPIHPEMLVWPGDPGVDVEATQRIAAGDAANVSRLGLGTHTGTHVDPPIHFVPGGATADELPLDALIGPSVVVDLTELTGPVDEPDLEAACLRDGCRRLLLKTRNSRMWARGIREFPGDYAALTPAAARWIVDRGIRLVGVDFLSVEMRGTPGHPTHRVLLEAGVVIVEGLDLSSVDPGSYRLVCLPLKIAGGDGAPARAVLVEDED